MVANAGLDPGIKALRDKFDPNDRYNDAWLDEAHNYLMKLSDDDTTFFNDELEDNILEMTDESYNEIFMGNEKPKEIWYIAFIRKRRSAEGLWFSAYLVNTMRLIADEYKDTNVRFAFVNARKKVSEGLKETFDVKILPQSFVYADGIFYE